MASDRVRWDKLTRRDVFLKYSSRLRPHIMDILAGVSAVALTQDSIDEAFNRLTSAISTVSLGLPRSKFRKNLKPYWNPDLQELKRQKILTYQVWVREGRPREPTDDFYIRYKAAKKAFCKHLVRCARRYENEEILEAVRLAEVNKNSFWRLLQKCRGTSNHKSLSIKRLDRVIVHDIDEVLEVWRTHFTALGEEGTSPTFDQNHYEEVTDFVRDYNDSNAMDDTFLVEEFTVEEIRIAVNSLNLGKSPGFDSITAEHIINADVGILELICVLFNGIRDLEYVPRCFRYGVQVPLFKRKDLCGLDPNNYRGITLLSTYNKLFEIVVWNRLKLWWVDEGVISELQGACKSGLSCLHTAFALQEAIATSLEAGDRCLVAFYDVTKAFDSVWIDGLFRQVFGSGITGKTWRILYRSYVDFQCCVKIQGHFSEWYNISRGIHQGGFMSLLKYTVYINSLLVQLKTSDLCCKIYRLPSAPVGYADDLAAGCIDEYRLNQVMRIVHRHGCTWRYEFNARKSGVLIYNGDPLPIRQNAPMREFNLGDAKVFERLKYDHVGIRTSTNPNDTSGIAERISKARKTLNAATGLGSRECGLTIGTCNIIFWSLVVPTALYGCEIWHLSNGVISILESF